MVSIKAADDDVTASRSYDEHLEESKDNILREYHQGGVDGDSSRSYDEMDLFKGRVTKRTNRSKESETELDPVQVKLNQVEERKN